MPYQEKEPIKGVVSAIYDELKDTETYHRGKNERSLKSHVRNISMNISEHLAEQKQESFNKNHSTNWALGILSFIAICLLANSAQENPDYDWIENNKLALKIWGVSLAAIYIGASLDALIIFQIIVGVFCYKNCSVSFILWTCCLFNRQSCRCN
ncbi:hypothetical protein [Microbulbifer sp. ANSA005]|uniref:hypothetical protein n=1 Tax=Microbulbifer sp. ANSA005 TaxID=3243362 RepID=UPI0040430EC1